MSRAQKAKEYFLSGYACSQAVALAFADVMQIKEDEIAKYLLPFGGGLGRLRLTCGAVSGMAFVIGALFAKSENTPENKMTTYALTQQLCDQFKEECGSLICGELLKAMEVPVEVGGAPEARTAQYYQKRSCAEIVEVAARIVEDYAKEQGVL